MLQLQLCDEWDRVVALPRHKFVTGATLLQLYNTVLLPDQWQKSVLYSENYFLSTIEKTVIRVN